MTWCSRFSYQGMGVALAAVAFYNRDKPAWQRDMPKLMILALGQVALGFVSWLLIALSN